MKETGMTRRVDELGRIVIPKEIRQIFKIKVGTPLEIFVEGDRLVMQKYQVAEGYAELLESVTESLCNATGLTAISFNTEKVVSAKGTDAYAFGEAVVSDALFEKFAQRQPFICDANLIADVNGKTAYVYPLINKGDLFGATAIVCEGEISVADKKLVGLACDIFLKQLD